MVHLHRYEDLNSTWKQVADAAVPIYLQANPQDIAAQAFIADRTGLYATYYQPPDAQAPDLNRWIQAMAGVIAARPFEDPRRSGATAVSAEDDDLSSIESSTNSVRATRLASQFGFRPASRGPTGLTIDTSIIPLNSDENSSTPRTSNTSTNPSTIFFPSGIRGSPLGLGGFAFGGIGFDGNTNDQDAAQVLLGMANAASSAASGSNPTNPSHATAPAAMQRRPSFESNATPTRRPQLLQYTRSQGAAIVAYKLNPTAKCPEGYNKISLDKIQCLHRDSAVIETGYEPPPFAAVVADRWFLVQPNTEGVLKYMIFSDAFRDMMVAELTNVDVPTLSDAASRKAFFQRLKDKYSTTFADLETSFHRVVLAQFSLLTVHSKDSDAPLKMIKGDQYEKVISVVKGESLEVPEGFTLADIRATFLLVPDGVLASAPYTTGQVDFRGMPHRLARRIGDYVCHAVLEENMPTVVQDMHRVAKDASEFFARAKAFLGLSPEQAKTFLTALANATNAVRLHPRGKDSRAVAENYRIHYSTLKSELEHDLGHVESQVEYLQMKKAQVQSTLEGLGIEQGNEQEGLKEELNMTEGFLKEKKEKKALLESQIRDAEQSLAKTEHYS